MSHVFLRWSGIMDFKQISAVRTNCAIFGTAFGSYPVKINLPDAATAFRCRSVKLNSIQIRSIS